MTTFTIFPGALQIRGDLPSECPIADEPAFADYVKFLVVSLLPESGDDARSSATDSPSVRESALG